MKPIRGTLHVFADGEALAQGAADWLATRAQQSDGTFNLCLSGGSTPRRMYEILAAPPYLASFPWARTQFIFGDERFVPPTDHSSNAHMAAEAMFAHAPVPASHILAVPTVGITPAAAAEVYERTLKLLYSSDTLAPDRPLFDATLLGIGDDGHTASLIPGQPAVDETHRWVAVVAQGRPETRITLTFPPLQSSRATLFLVQGEGKTEILDRLLAGDDTVPAGRLRPEGELHWFADRAAAGRWAENS